MKEDVYQSMYHQIHLSDRQKHRIWAGIKEEADKSADRRKARLSLRGAVCVCAVLVASGITVLAANPSYVDRIAEALHGYGRNGEEATAEEKNLYAAYGSEMAYTWETAAGEVKLEAILYDAGYVYIPFTLYPNVDLIPGQDLLQDLETKQILSDVLEQACKDTGGAHYSFRVKGHDKNALAVGTQLNPIVQEDGTLKGNYSLHYVRTEEGGFARGDVIQRVRRYLWADALSDGADWCRVLEEGESTEGLTISEIEINGKLVQFVDLRPENEVLAEILLETAPLPKREISTAGTELPYGLKADYIAVTSLALYMYGTGDSNQPGAKISYNIFVVLKDGTVVERMGSEGGMNRDVGDENDGYNYSFTLQFAESIDPDDVAGIRITDRGEEILYIPVE